MDHVPAVRPAATSSAGWHSDAEISGVMIGTPAYGGQVTSRYLTSAIGTSELLRERLVTEDGATLPVAWCLTEGESLIQRARNSIVAKFMADPRLSHLIFIDSDIEWQARDVLRLIGHDVDVIGGIYPKKVDPLDFPIHPLTDERGKCRRNEVTGAIQIASAPTGFLCIKRAVFERMREAYPQLKYRLQEAAEAEREWMYAYFDAFVEDGILWSEDYGFCKRWREIGGEVWCDPVIQLGHVGGKIYRGSVEDLWQSLPADVPMPELPVDDPMVERRSLGEPVDVHGWQVPGGDPWFVPALMESGGHMDRETMAAALEHVGDFSRAVDIGAHIGTWARPLAASFGEVVAIEPDKEAFGLLLKNTEGLPNVRAIRGAAWDEEGQLDVRRTGVNSGENRVEEVNGAAALQAVRGLALDGLGLDEVGLIKIDVEGAEARVIGGARGTIERCRPVVVIEEGHSGSEAREMLEAMGMIEVGRYSIAPGFPIDDVVMAWPPA